MGLLRDQMKADMELRGYARSTQNKYLRYVQWFAAHSMTSPADMGEAEVREFLLHRLRVDGMGPPTHKMTVAALRFLYSVTLQRQEVALRIPYPAVPRALPQILSGTEVARLLAAVRHPTYRLMLSTVYGSGLRIGEVCRLEVSDIDGHRMTVHVRRSKGEDRYAPLPVRLLAMLRSYWSTRPTGGVYLFPGMSHTGQISQETLRTALKKAARAIGLVHKHVRPHLLRHAFATHLLETGTDIRVIQVLLGHQSIRTTERYTHVSRRHIGRVRSPMDLLGTAEAEPMG